MRPTLVEIVVIYNNPSFRSLISVVAVWFRRNYTHSKHFHTFYLTLFGPETPVRRSFWSSILASRSALRSPVRSAPFVRLGRSSKSRIFSSPALLSTSIYPSVFPSAPVPPSVRSSVVVRSPGHPSVRRFLRLIIRPSFLQCVHSSILQRRSVYSSVHLSVRPFVCPSVRLTVRQIVRSFVRLYVLPSVRLPCRVNPLFCISVSMSVRLHVRHPTRHYVCSSTRPSTHLSVCHVRQPRRISTFFLNVVGHLNLFFQSFIRIPSLRSISRRLNQSIN